MIIETTDNRKFRVWETKKEGLDHVWYGFRVKPIKGADRWANLAKARIELVSKAHLHRVVEA